MLRNALGTCFGMIKSEIIHGLAADMILFGFDICCYSSYLSVISSGTVSWQRTFSRVELNFGLRVKNECQELTMRYFSNPASIRVDFKGGGQFDLKFV